MCKNVGSADRLVRIVFGTALVALVFVGPQTPWGWIGLIPLVTGIFSFCPLYSLFGFKTCCDKPKGKQSQEEE